MTNMYIRVQRDGKWQPVELEYLTKEERAEALSGKSAVWLLRCIDLLCKTIARGEEVKA